MSQPDDEVTRLLHDWSDGNREALGRLMPLVFDELRRIANGYFAREGGGHTLQPTALVHEVYLKLMGRRTVQWQNRAHFFGFAAELMRRILVDHARSRQTAKRGAGALKVPLDEELTLVSAESLDLVALDDALKDLAAVDPRQAKIVELRFFAGLKNEEVAEMLEISVTTVKREWRMAKMWLYRELRRR